MKIQIERLNNAVHLRATNEDGAALEMDGSPTVGGENKGFRPMQMLLAALGGCSTIDIMNILKKQRKSVDDISIIVEV